MKIIIIIKVNLFYIYKFLFIHKILKTNKYINIIFNKLYNINYNILYIIVSYIYVIYLMVITTNEENF